MSSLNLLQEYLRLILISEGKVEDLAKQNPNVDVMSLASSDLTKTLKIIIVVEGLYLDKHVIF
jgi:hypothetical protein